MNFNTLRNNLQLPYSQKNWKEWLLFIFGQQISIEIQAEKIPILAGKAKSIERFASITLSDEKNIAVLDITTITDVKIAKNRVELRDIAFKLIDQDKYHGTLVFYHSENENQLDYRLSFISKQTTIDEDGNFKIQSTNAKRYSFILGDNESCYTATKNLLELKNKVPAFKAFETQKGITLKDLTDTFSVEALNNEFFKKYKDIHYKRFWEYIANHPDFSVLLLNKDETELINQQKPIRDFVKKMLGRIVFLHFLQKKGWMGCPADLVKWENGDKNFMLNLFTNYPNKNEFYSKCLTILFFQILNTDRKKKNDVIPKALQYINPNSNSIECRAPFLNGGLFDDDLPQTNNFNFPVEYFKDLFDFFSQYNFTIDENSPEEQEVGIDPEMLGHIFENLLEENKDKGVFYTPKEIVHYMCQESLIEYLLSHLPECTEKNNEATLAIENLIRKDDIGNRNDKKNFIVANAKRIENLLDKVKICDPAIGSGAFPMGMLQEIFKAKTTLDLTLDKAQVKKDIIRHNIYGVDLEKGAVDIARLRFWLSLVVDEEVPQSLPNLDYKIMQGNSLLERFEDVDLSALLNNKKKSDELFENDSLLDIKSKEKLQQLIDLYFDFEANTNNKYKSKQEVKKAISSIIEDKLKEYFSDLKVKLENQKSEQEALQKSTVINPSDPKGIVEKKQKSIDKLNKIIDALSYKINHLKDILEKISQWEKDDKERPYFLWHTYFKDVFKNGGFDILIGNPPYIQLQKMGKEADRLEKAEYKTFTRTGDIYCLFYEKGIEILKPNGVLAYITSNTWMRTKFGELMRKYFREKTQTVSLINFEDTKIFQTATVETNIIISKSKSENKPFKAVAVKADYTLGTNIYEYFQLNAIEIKETKDDGWIILSKDDSIIKSEIEKNGIQLKNWDVEFYRGFLTGFNDAFFIDEEKKEEIIKNEPKAEKFIKPLLRGRNIAKYGYVYDNIYVLFIPWHFPLTEDNISGASKEAEQEFENQYPVIYNHMLKYKKELADRNKSETGIRYEWYALQRAAATYVNEFEKVKLVWLSISDKPAFALDTKNIYVTAPAYILTSNSISCKYLMLFLNSKAMEWYLDKVSSSTGQGTNQWSKIFVEQLPIPKIEDELIIQKIEILADYLTFLNDAAQPPVNIYTDNYSIAPVFEDVANMMVYEMYFTQHMKELDLDVLQFIDTEKEFKPIDTSPKADKEKNKKIIGDCYKWLQVQDNKIRNRIILSNIKSKDIIRRINSTTH